MYFSRSDLTHHSILQIYCSRYINQHMLMHTQSTNHPIVLSFYDISMWCYGCDDFVDNIVRLKNIQILNYFGTFE